MSVISQRHIGNNSWISGSPRHAGFWLILFLLVLLGSSAQANQVTLAWDPSDDATGYRLYWGTESGVYSQSQDVGNITSYTVPLLVNTITYYFSVTAYNEAGESDYSSEIRYTIPPLPTLVYLQVSPSPDILSWSLPEQPDTLLGFIVFRKETGVAETNRWTVFDPNARSFSMADDIPLSSYKFWVVGFTRFGRQQIFSESSPTLEYTKAPVEYLFNDHYIYPLTKMEDGRWRILFYGLQHWDNLVEASGDLTHWRMVGPAEEFVTGWYRAYDSSTAPWQFYRIIQ